MAAKPFVFTSRLARLECMLIEPKLPGLRARCVLLAVPALMVQIRPCAPRETFQTLRVSIVWVQWAVQHAVAERYAWMERRNRFALQEVFPTALPSMGVGHQDALRALPDLCARTEL